MARDFFVELHPGVQLFYFAVVISISMLLPHPAVIGCSFLGAVGYSILLEGWQRGFRFQVLYMLPMTLFVILINGMFSHYGVTPLYYLKTGAVTLEALVYGAVLAWMLWTSIVWFSVVNQVMSLDRWVYLLGRCSPIFSLALAIILRFIPRCRQQFIKIREGRESLGLERQRHLWGRIKSGGKQLSMLLTWSLESGVELADSMRARCYGAGRRTAYKNYRMNRGDRVMLSLLIMLSAVFAGGFLTGCGRAEYNPAVRLAPLGKTPLSVIAYSGWAFFCFLPLICRGIRERQRRRWERRMSARQSVGLENGNIL